MINGMFKWHELVAESELGGQRAIFVDAYNFLHAESEVCRIVSFKRNERGSTYS